MYVGPVAPSGLRVLTWNLFHGRAVPPAGRELLEDYGNALSGWDWDVALLQEVPPWWPGALADHARARQRLVLTSRNFALPVRRALARRWPDVAKSNGGGCNAILVRGQTIATHRAKLLGRVPERRWVHAVRLGSGSWAANLHTEAQAAQGQAAARTVLDWAGADEPVVLGGDFNVREPALAGLERAGASGVDQVWARGLRAAEAEVLVRPASPGGGVLSDHAPLVVTLRG